MTTRTLAAALLFIGIGSSPLQAACPGGVSSYFTVSGEVTKRAVFDLGKLDVDRYERAFRDNDTDSDILGERTADDLIALGIKSVGHRRKLLAAIANVES
jgi:hypothetical protein